ncbi:sensor histidine kinase [Asaia krungthepensis]|uniref:histidine kinase n=1 Tax=Asaia krungthepensis NRIC 0535 TaxID=1307925 RepID=A0ABQ0Q223_9PROT|nr:sensor histidine kinase KdpD [Asaia krungthepensis]GBQ87668.1 two component sensor histidine kinase KdpD [Asaia krungthepensis NRIC 0535]
MSRQDYDRPDPDALLRQGCGDQKKGRLKIFLGAAPGVGKTFEMLSTARQLLREGADLAIGVVETHGRAETKALVGGLPVIPTAAVAYRGQILQEMDLDAILIRRPALVLVDELAHSNAPGSRHPKRWMDVEEILAAGIDVFTTVNIQHVESLNDVVASITRVRVRETVPDRVIETANELELVDLTPNDLLQRMRDGKIYGAHTAGRAMLHYFSPGNLTALRELALRRTAQQVDAQLLDHMKANAISGPWAAGERVMVCLTLEEGDSGLMRYGKRLADRLHAPWIVLHVETSRDLTDDARARMAAQMQLAQSLGAETVTLPGHDIALDALAYARAQNVTQIVAAHPAGTGWMGRLRQLLGRSTTERLIQRSDGFPVHVVPRSGEAPAHRIREARKTRLSPYLASSAIVMAALGLALLLRQGFEVSNVSLAFLTAILGVAVAYGLGPSLWASILGMLCFNFFFLPPLYTLTIAAPDNVVALFFFFATALIAGNLGARVRSQAVVARHRAETTQSLYRFSRMITGISTLEDLLWSVSQEIARLIDCHVVLLLPDAGALAIQASSDVEKPLGEDDFAAASWAWKHSRIAGRGSDNLPGVRWLFIPMRTVRGPVALIGLNRTRDGRLLDAEQQGMLDALADQAASAIESILLTRDLDRVRLEAETDRLRGALLTSISHDLRTPLASILGAASSLRDYGEVLGEEGRSDLLTTVTDEAERLNRFVGNLLDMTRLEAGALPLRHDSVDCAEVAATALSRASRLLEHHRVRLDAMPDLPMLPLDAVLLEQALFNILDNAAKYTREGTAVVISLRTDDSHLTIAIADEGPGFGDRDPSAIFGKFTRFAAADTTRAGTGLGLAIARGFVEAMGGRIEASNRSEGIGAVFALRFPLHAVPARTLSLLPSEEPLP